MMQEEGTKKKGGVLQGLKNLLPGGKNKNVDQNMGGQEQGGVGMSNVLGGATGAGSVGGTERVLGYAIGGTPAVGTTPVMGTTTVVGTSPVMLTTPVTGSTLSSELTATGLGIPVKNVNQTAR